MDGGDAVADRAFSYFEFAVAGDERGVSYFDTVDVGYGVIRAGCTVEGDAKVAGSGLGLGEGESASTQKKSAEKCGRKWEETKLHHRCGSIVRLIVRRWSVGGSIKHGYLVRAFSGTVQSGI